MNEHDQIRGEAIYFVTQLTGETPDDTIVDNYIRLHQFYFKNESEQDAQFLRKLVSRNLPLEPIECITRRKFPILGKKVNAIIYLLECCSKYGGLFSDKDSTPLRAFVLLAFVGVRMPFIYAYGIYLGVKHGLL